MRPTDFGAFVELAEGIEGLCHVSEIEERRPKGDREKEKPARGDRVTSVLASGKEYDFKILRLEPEQHKISLSFRAAQKQAERQEIETYLTSVKTRKVVVAQRHDRRRHYGQAPVVVTRSITAGWIPAGNATWRRKVVYPALI